MSDLITFTRAGSDLVVLAAIPREINEGKDQHYTLRVSLGGSPISVEALARYLQRAMEERIRTIRREAYQQGARDRARRATSFSGSWDIDFWKGGCT